MQNGFCHSSGSFSKAGLPVARQAAIVPAIGRVTSLCRFHGIPIVYTRMEFDEDFSDAGITFVGIEGVMEVNGLVRGTWDAQILDALQPSPEDIVVSKRRHSAFIDTDLRRLLADRGIDQIIATGVATNLCVESTVREAWAHGLYAITVSDATGTWSEEEQMASMTNMRNFGGTISTQELESELHKWKQSEEKRGS